MASKITTIIFDLGNVLITWDPYLLYRKLFDKDEDIK
jgi:2-haloacid dehalogenase